jgi:mRNA interferase MazF
MARFIVGDVVIVPFPFSDLSQTKRRPALVVAGLSGEDLILCQITSQAVMDEYAVPILSEDFSVGGLNQNSNVRPNRIFTVSQHIVAYKAGEILPSKLTEVIDKIVEILYADRRRDDG